MTTTFPHALIRTLFRPSPFARQFSVMGKKNRAPPPHDPTPAKKARIEYGNVRSEKNIPLPLSEALYARKAEGREDWKGGEDRMGDVDYRGKACLAPMVRSGTLPNRLLSLMYGCDLVWGPETVDKSICNARRVVNEQTGLVDYIRAEKSIWWTHPIEKPYLIFQLGTADPKFALEAALTVQPDVAGIDLNCGCPKPFSTHNGAGAALLSTPDLLCSILTTLVENLYVPVSCKIRLLEDQEETKKLVERICGTGIKCLTIHARTRDMRSRERAMMERLRDLVEVATRFGVPVVANGDVGGMWDFEKIKEMTGVSSIMIARAAESNPSCFLPDKPLDTTTVVIPQLIRLTSHFDNPWGNTKFLINQFSPSPASIAPKSLSRNDALALRSTASSTKTYPDLAKAWGVSLGDEEDVINGTSTAGEEAMRDVQEGIERRKKEREAGVWALGGEEEKRVVEEERGGVEMTEGEEVKRMEEEVKGEEVGKEAVGLEAAEGDRVQA